LGAVVEPIDHGEVHCLKLELVLLPPLEAIVDDGLIE
jgi:hypothetical protein